MNTLSTFFLHSARLYSGLADSIFEDSVEQSQFASTISTRRMQTAKSIIGTSRDIEIELDDEDMEILGGAPSWQSCLALDNLLMRVMKVDERKFLPLLAGVFTAAHRGAAYASQTGGRPKHKQCLCCGAVTEQWTCPICANEKNWLTGIEVPENEAPETIEDAAVSLPNLSFADFPPEKPVQPKKWEVLFDGREDDIFKATGMVRPTL